jgi:hypothetical protein
LTHATKSANYNVLHIFIRICTNLFNAVTQGLAVFLGFRQENRTGRSVK